VCNQAPQHKNTHTALTHRKAFLALFSAVFQCFEFETVFRSFHIPHHTDCHRARHPHGHHHTHTSIDFECHIATCHIFPQDSVFFCIARAALRVCVFACVLLRCALMVTAWRLAHVQPASKQSSCTKLLVGIIRLGMDRIAPHGN